VKKAVFHKKFHFWTRAINQIQNLCKKKIFFEFENRQQLKYRIKKYDLSKLLCKDFRYISFQKKSKYFKKY
jgi:hypothetical protein